MNRRYLLLIGAVVAGALAVNLLARMPRGPRPGEVEAEAVPSVELALSVAGGRLSPESGSAPKGHRVLLRVTNDGDRPVSLRLAGYDDRVSRDSLLSGSTWTTEFLADRPGDDFVWLVDGHPAGRLAVTGSHLIEGHR
jgi:hypothetical protein